MSGGLVGKAVLTGTARGIGRGHATLFAAEIARGAVAGVLEREDERRDMVLGSLYLASDEAGHISDAELAIDGGRSLP